mmetsp:Transcript_21945/g.33357  ORF Transcript_21945/g.33357 Transcript_21945/m.33357 type:complete len:99 (+) Transcript_21945:992-1288(+)
MTFLEYISIYVRVSLVIPSNVMRFGQGKEIPTTYVHHIICIKSFTPFRCVCSRNTQHCIVSSHNQSSKQPKHFTIFKQQSISYVPSPTHNIIQGNAIN